MLRITRPGQVYIRTDALCFCPLITLGLILRDLIGREFPGCRKVLCNLLNGSYAEWERFLFKYRNSVKSDQKWRDKTWETEKNPLFPNGVGPFVTFIFYIPVWELETAVAGVQSVLFIARMKLCESLWEKADLSNSYSEDVRFDLAVENAIIESTAVTDGEQNCSVFIDTCAIFTSFETRPYVMWQFL